MVDVDASSSMGPDRDYERWVSLVPVDSSVCVGVFHLYCPVGWLNVGSVSGSDSDGDGWSGMVDDV